MEWIIGLLLILVAFMVVSKINQDKNREARKEARNIEKAQSDVARQHIATIEQEMEQDWQVIERESGWRHRNYLMMSGDQQRLRFASIKFSPDVEIRSDAAILVSDIVTVELQQSSETIMRF